MSGARAAPSPANGVPVPAPATTGAAPLAAAREAPKRCPAMSATRARSAIPATAQGRAFEPAPAECVAATGAAPAGVPQR
jgi:hypothetical protein